jgi:DNA (cytosine-5)-methyltransferase 1
VITLGDLFCGAGIGGLGFKQAGAKTVYAFDNNPHAITTFNQNVEPVAYLQDANDLDVDALPDVDVITAGFPCKPFSVMGKRLGIADEKDGNLAFITLDIIERKQPKAFLIENVKGIINKRNIDFFTEYIKEYEKSYNVTWKCVDCSDYGIPQKRERVFIIGIRKDIDATFTFPEPTGERMTVREAIGDLKDLDPNIPNHGESLGLRNDEKPYAHKIPWGGNWRDLPVDEQKAFMKKGFYNGGGRTGNLWKVHPDKPAKTILSTPDGKATAQILHWEGREPRRYSVRESLRLQSVPDTFVFPDTVPMRKQYERCSGIPTKMAELLMTAIKETLDDI